MPRPHVGMGVTFHWAADIYAGTVSRVSEDGTTLWFRQDRPLRRDFGWAFLFVEDVEAPEFEAMLRGDVYILNVEGHRRPIEPGVRSWYSTRPPFT